MTTFQTTTFVAANYIPVKYCSKTIFPFFLLLLNIKQGDILLLLTKTGLATDLAMNKVY